MIGGSFFHMLRVLAHFDTPNTQTTLAEQQALKRHASGRRRAVEIGVYEGANTRLIADHLEASGVLYAIDPFFSGRLPICWGEIVARSHVRRGQPAGRVEFVKMLSWEAAQQIDGTFDFIFVDGDHSLDGIRRDWNDWAGRVRSGGVIALHDTRVPNHDPSVAELGSHQYYESHIRSDDRFSVCDQVDSLTVLERRAS
jgi:predicted O-methyltransferase YrrM